MLSQIAERNFELIRKAIGRVLTAEFANQYTLNEAASSGTGISVSVTMEQSAPIDKEDLPQVNIVWAESQKEDDPTAFSSIYDNKFLVEIYTSGVSGSDDRGDKLAAYNLSRIAGMIDYILKNPIYAYLDFTDKTFIRTRHIQQMVRTQPRQTDSAENILSGVIEVHYIAEETTELQTGKVEALLDTVVKIAETEKGYKFQIVNS
ncbi:MAG: hypothetical protein H6Q17_557 [Bacteroidetes bacterium]|nr:hypothetical protein [Bacteroidota bacterium]